MGGLVRCGGIFMANLFKAIRKAARLAGKGRPISAAFALQTIVTPPTQKPKRKRSKPAPKTVIVRRKKSSAARPKPQPGTFLNAEFNCRQGSLSYKIYTPKGSTRRRMPLIVMLHGCSQSAADFAAGTGMNGLADELGFLVLYPQQSLTANIAGCWNWHSPENQSRGRGEPAVIAALTRHVVALCGANRSRIYIAGISAGGAAAAIIAAAYPDLYVAVGVHSGVALGNIRSLSAAMASMRGKSGAGPSGKLPRQLPTIVFHGDNDRVVHPSNASGFLDNLERSRLGPITSRAYRGRSAWGRDYTRRVHKNGRGEVLLEDWTVHGSGHSWSGGKPIGSHTDPAGPDASREMVRFFLARKREPKVTPSD